VAEATIPSERDFIDTHLGTAPEDGINSLSLFVLTSVLLSGGTVTVVSIDDSRRVVSVDVGVATSAWFGVGRPTTVNPLILELFEFLACTANAVSKVIKDGGKARHCEC